MSPYTLWNPTPMPIFRNRQAFHSTLLVALLFLLWPSLLAAGPDPRPNLILLMALLPIKMVARWAFNMKYFISVPEYFLNF